MDESMELKKKELVKQWLGTVDGWNESDQKFVEMIVDLVFQAYQKGMEDGKTVCA